jgi:hypothetical protein
MAKMLLILTICLLALVVFADGDHDSGSTESLWL